MNWFYAWPPGWQAALWVGGLLLAYAVGSNLAAMLLVSRWPGLVSGPGNFWRLLALQTLLGLVITLLLAVPLGFDLAGLGFTRRQLAYSLSLTLGAGLPLALLAALVVALAPVRWLRGFAWGEARGRDLWGRYGVGGLLAPVAEEVFFRGLVQGGLLQILTAGVSVAGVFVHAGTLVASVVFVLVHAANVLLRVESAGQFLLGLPIRLAVGLLLGYAFQETASLVAPVLVHCLYNTCSFVALTYRQRRPDWPNR